MWAAAAVVEGAEVEGNAEEEEIARPSTSVRRALMDQTAQLVRHESGHCTA